MAATSAEWLLLLALHPQTTGDTTHCSPAGSHAKRCRDYSKGQPKGLCAVCFHSYMAIGVGTLAHMRLLPVGQKGPSERWPGCHLWEAMKVCYEGLLLRALPASARSVVITVLSDLHGTQHPLTDPDAFFASK